MEPDWFDDVIAVTDQLLAVFRLERLPLVARVPHALQRVLDGRFGPRRHRGTAAAVAACGFGAAITVAGVAGEGLPSNPADRLWLSLLFLPVATAGMLRFLLAAGSLLRIVRPLQGGSGARSSGAVVLAVAVSASVPVTLALRDQLPWVRTYADSGTPAQLLFRLIVVAAVLPVLVVCATTRPPSADAPAPVRTGPSGSGRARPTDTYLGAHYQRLRGRRGTAKATKAVGHQVLVAADHILDRDQPYQDLGADWFVRRRPATQVRKLISQLNTLGDQVTLNPIQAA